MRPTIKKLAVKDISALEKLVAENVESIETGLKVIDTRLLLGQAAIDLVGLDEKGALVFIALDLTADEALLLRVMDAYSWCLEYPEAIHRLYPMAQSPAQRPPRVLFIVERLTDSFVRRIKQLSFLEMDCLEFRHLEVNGVSALYFDLVQRLRRGEPIAEGQAQREAPQAVIAPAPSAPAVEPVVAAPAPEVRASEPVPAAPRAWTPAPANGAPPPTPVAPVPELPVEISQEAECQELPGGPLTSLANEWEKLLGQLDDNPLAADIAADEPATPAEAESAAEMAVTTGDPSEVEAPRWELALVQEPENPAPVSESTAVTPPAWASRPEKTPQPRLGRAYFFAQASKGAAPEVPPPAVSASASEPPAPVPPATDAPAVTQPGLESISFPKDGLSRQWLEFLNQLSAPK